MEWSSFPAIIVFQISYLKNNELFFFSSDSPWFASVQFSFFLMSLIHIIYTVLSPAYFFQLIGFHSFL